MSLKKKVAAIAAALTTVCAMSAAAAIPASAATPACGQYCIGVFSSELGTFAAAELRRARVRRRRQRSARRRA